MHYNRVMFYCLEYAMSNDCKQCGEHAVDCECDTPKMLPCPFCGWEKIRIFEEEKQEPPLQGSKYTYCYCRVCGTRGPWAYTVDENMKTVIKRCIERWNERGGIKQ